MMDDSAYATVCRAAVYLYRCVGVGIKQSYLGSISESLRHGVTEITNESQLGI